MRYLVLLILLIEFSLSIKAQESFIHNTLDTLKASYRIGGKTLDSIDLVYSEKFTSTPGSFTSHPFGKFGNDYRSFWSSLSRQHRLLPVIGFKYAALPHLGTCYAFGSKGTQYLDVEFNQSFSKKIHFSFQYKRNVATGAYRNNAFSNDFFSIGGLYKGNHFGHMLSLSTFKQQRNLNGGISSFSEVEEFGLEYAKVRKQNSSDSISMFVIDTDSEWNIIKNDSLKTFSIILKNKLAIDKRVFKEKDSLSTLYPNAILFDSLNTRELTQLSRLDNMVGLRIKNQKVLFEILIDKGYWKYKTLSTQFKDELDVLANLFVNGKTWNLQTENQFNLLGANQQSKYSLLLIRKGKKINFECNLNQSNLLPTPLQRAYITNTINYVLEDLDLQHSQTIKLSFNTNNKQSIKLSAFYGNFQNHYFFVNDSWKNDTLKSVSQLTLQAKGDFKLGVFHLQPNLTLNLVDKIQLLPKYDLRTRFFISKNVKRPGTIFNVGVDVNYLSTYQLMTFDDRISMYQMNFKNGNFNDYLMLDAFVSMQLDEFRMYLKMENVDSFWVSPRNNIAKDYPIVPSIMRLGLTWDFFN